MKFISILGDLSPDARTKSLWNILLFGGEQGPGFSHGVESRGQGSVMRPWYPCLGSWHWGWSQKLPFQRALRLLHQLSSFPISLVIPIIASQWTQILMRTCGPERSGPDSWYPLPSICLSYLPLRISTLSAISGLSGYPPYPQLSKPTQQRYFITITTEWIEIKFWGCLDFLMENQMRKFWSTWIIEAISIVIHCRCRQNASWRKKLHQTPDRPDFVQN